MKIDQRTCRYQYKTCWYQNENNIIITYGVKNGNLNPEHEKAFLCNTKLKENKTR